MKVGDSSLPSATKYHLRSRVSCHIKSFFYLDQSDSLSFFSVVKDASKSGFKIGDNLKQQEKMIEGMLVFNSSLMKSPFLITTFSL